MTRRNVPLALFVCVLFPFLIVCLIRARQPVSTLIRALLLLNMHNTCSRPAGVAQVRCCATLVQILVLHNCCTIVAQLLHSCCTAVAQQLQPRLAKKSFLFGRTCFQYNKRLLRQKTGGAFLYMPQDGH